MDQDLRTLDAFSKWAITADDAERRLARAMKICVGNELRKMWQGVLDEPLPLEIADLLHRLDH